MLSGSTALIVAASKNNIQCVKILLQLQPDVNAVDESGCTALHTAANNCHHECLDLLIKAGADVNLTDKLDHTPFYNDCLARRPQMRRVTYKCRSRVEQVFVLRLHCTDSSNEF